MSLRYPGHGPDCKPIPFDRSTDYNDAERQREVEREGRDNDLAEMRRHR